MRDLSPRWLSHVLPVLAAATASATALAAQASTPLQAYHAPRVIGTSLDVLVAAHDPIAADRAYAAVQTEIARLEAMLSTRIPTSIISQINQTNAPVAVPHEVLELLAAYDRAATLTQGICSPLMGELTTRWSQAAKENSRPSTSELQTLVQGIQNTTLTIDREASTVQRIGPATLNIDALGKPFILARAAQAAWTTPGLAGLLVNIGGDIVALGSMSTTHATPWTVEVADPARPADNAPALATLLMTRPAVVTSADYARARTIAGQSISHMFDPRTGLPASHGLSATVMHEDPVTANALATAFCVAGPEARHFADAARADYLLAAHGNQTISPTMPIVMPVDADAPATAPAAWPKDFKVSIPVDIIAPTGRTERACVAVWIEDSKGTLVKSLAVWGNDRYASNALNQWTKVAPRGAKTAATRNPGNYTLDWDGTDQNGKPVTDGKYTVHIEVAYRYDANKHSIATATIDCEKDKATAKITKNGSIDASTITYGPPDQPAK